MECITENPVAENGNMTMWGKMVLELRTETWTDIVGKTLWIALAYMLYGLSGLHFVPCQAATGAPVKASHCKMCSGRDL